MRLLAVLLVMSAGLAAGEVLTPVAGGRQTNVNDSQGFRWDFDVRNGWVNDGSNDCFDTGLRLNINGQQFQCQQPMQTKDGELVLQGQQSGDGVTVTRRIRIEPQLAVVRFLEIVANTSNQPRNVTLLVHSCLGNNAQAVTTTSGGPVGSTLGPKDVGLFALQTPQNGSRPSVLFILGTAKSAAPPQISAGDGRQFGITYQLTVPPGKRLAIVHLVAQRNAVPDVAKEAAALLKALPKMAMPAELMRLVANLRVAAEPEVAVGTLPALDRWCEARGLARGGEDLLLTGDGDGQQARGAMRGAGVSVLGSAAKQFVALAEIAGVVGAGAPGAPGRLFLRNGEVLCGALSATDLALVAGGGSIAVDPSTTPGLVLRGDRSDGQDVGAGLAMLPDGDQLVLTAAPAPIALIGVCGAVPLDFATLASLIRLRGERQGWEATWVDGSHLVGFLDGKDLALATRRRGAITLPVHELDGFVHPQRRAPAELEPFDHAELRNGDRLVGALAKTALNVQGRAGPAAVEPARIRSIARGDGDSLVIELAGGGQLVGLPQGPGLAVERPGGAVIVPWPALERWAQAAQEDAPPPAAAPTDPRLATTIRLAPGTSLTAHFASIASQLKVRLDYRCDKEFQEITQPDDAEQTAGAALDALLRDTGLGYRLQGDLLVIQPIEAFEAQPGVTP